MMNSKQDTLEKMVQDSFSKFPSQLNDSVKEAIEEYIENSQIQYEDQLKEKLQNPEYFKQFETGMAYTYTIFFLALLSVINNDSDIDFQQYTREFLYHSRTDDKYIYDMKMYYFSNLNADEFGLNDLNLTEEEIHKTNEEIKEEFNILIKKLSTEYKKIKSFI